MFTFFSVVGDGAEVEKVGPDDGVSDSVAFPQLDLDALAERGKHFGEDNLLVPHRLVRILLDRSFALQHNTQ